MQKGDSGWRRTPETEGGEELQALKWCTYGVSSALSLCTSFFSDCDILTLFAGSGFHISPPFFSTGKDRKEMGRRYPP